MLVEGPGWLLPHCLAFAVALVMSVCSAAAVDVLALCYKDRRGAAAEVLESAWHNFEA